MLQSFLFFSMFSKAQYAQLCHKEMFGYKPPIIGISRQYLLEKHQPPTRTANIRWTNIEHSLQMDGKHFLVGGLEHFWFFPYIGNNHPNWRFFSREVETTNQIIVMQFMHPKQSYYCSYAISMNIYDWLYQSLLGVGKGLILHLTQQGEISSPTNTFLKCNNSKTGH